MIMKYRKRFVDSDEWKDVSYEQALHALLGTYRDNDITREMLTMEGIIPCMFSEVEVYVAD